MKANYVNFDLCKSNCDTHTQTLWKNALQPALDMYSDIRRTNVVICCRSPARKSKTFEFVDDFFSVEFTFDFENNSI